MFDQRDAGAGAIVAPAHRPHVVRGDRCHSPQLVVQSAGVGHRYDIPT